MNTSEAASYLGISVKTLYKWKQQALANRGELVFHGKAVPFRYRQTGVSGQGRILFERLWLDELKSAMEGKAAIPRENTKTKRLKNINVALGVPPV